MSIQTTLMATADRVAGALGLLDRPIRAERLIARARRQTGLSDFGDADIDEPLGRLVDACSREAGLSLFGRLATEWDMVRFLSNLLRMQAAEVADPSIRARRVDQPIFITGLPRSGTTFLHRLMMHDPANRAPLVYETIFPFAPDGRDNRAEKVGRQLRAFEKIAPEFAALHPLDAVSPQECSEIAAHVFRSLRFDTNYLIPSYRHWMDADESRHGPAYLFHRRFLQHLIPQPQPGGRWVLKCPEHLFALGALRAAYPDARIVFVHRDPVKVLLSVAKLTEVLRRPFTRGLDPQAIGRDESARWLDGTQRMIAVGDDAGFPEPVCHVHHLDLITDPRATVAGVYQHFGLTLPDSVGSAIERYDREKPKGGYGPRSYRFEEHGLDEAEERAKFQPYMIRFGITPEGTGSRPAAPSATPVPLGA